METSILVCKPRSVKKADKDILREAGVIVIETENPDDIKFIRPEADISHSDMLGAAALAIQESGEPYDDTRLAFSNAVTNLLLK